MATSVGPVPAVCTTRGMPFQPTNGVAAIERRQTVELAIREAREQARAEARKFRRTRRSKGAWGK